jgi:Asp-tRNA(Asn)/Glu-tRNA(Gln) amidotransferase A subunit family amidase
MEEDRVKRYRETGERLTNVDQRFLDLNHLYAETEAKRQRTLGRLYGRGGAVREDVADEVAALEAKLVELGREIDRATMEKMRREEAIAANPLRMPAPMRYDPFTVQLEKSVNLQTTTSAGLAGLVQQRILEMENDRRRFDIENKQAEDIKRMREIMEKNNGKMVPVWGGVKT